MQMEGREGDSVLNLYEAVLTKALRHRLLIPATDVGVGDKTGRS